MPTDETTATPAYLPWKTFTNTLDSLAQNLPNRIDRTAFPGQSGSAQNQLILAFRFFGLITDEGKPTSTLLGLAVTDEAARKNALRKLIEHKYAELFALNLAKTTPAEFAEKMTAAYNVTGDTRLKATRFFLNAAEYLGIGVSTLLLRDKTKALGNGTTGRRRRSIRIPVEPYESKAEREADETGSVVPGESRSIELQSGGTLTLSVTTQFLALSAADRAFVFGLFDKLMEYERENPPPHVDIVAK